MEITGAILVGFADRVGAASFAAVDPATGRNIGPDFHEAGAADVADDAALAERAFAAFSETAPEARALFLAAIAQEIVAIGEALIERAMIESGLQRQRQEGEEGSTGGELRQCARGGRDSGWPDLTIDPAAPD